jgi:hypothetical protein
MNTEIAIRKQEIKLERSRLDRESLHKVIDTGKEVTIAIVSNPIPAFTLTILGLDYLVRHGSVQGDGVWRSYVSADTADKLATTLAGALIAGGLVNVIGALK